MKDEIIVFVGPSLGREEAATLLDARYLPPAVAGSVASVVDAQPRAIAVIDGLFEQVPAVTHKELLYALHRGIPVYGASSMGALRAAELAAFGMQGRGWVFERYHAGDLEDDDEVAIAHADVEHGFRPLCDAMASIRFTLDQAVASGVLSSQTRARLTDSAKSAFYPERSWPALERTTQLWNDAAEQARFRQWRAQHYVDIKAEDARGLLRELGSSEPKQPLEVPEFRFASTHFFTSLRATWGHHRSGSGATQ